jgi:FKBP-type peptidyl-prolyl cis-trans isomerase (trigger factor)
MLAPALTALSRSEEQIVGMNPGETREINVTFR